MLSNESLRIVDTSDQSTRILESVSNSSVVASSGPLVAFSENSLWSYCKHNFGRF